MCGPALFGSKLHLMIVFLDQFDNTIKRPVCHWYLLIIMPCIEGDSTVDTDHLESSRANFLVELIHLCEYDFDIVLLFCKIEFSEEIAIKAFDHHCISSVQPNTEFVIIIDIKDEVDELLEFLVRGSSLLM